MSDTGRVDRAPAPGLARLRGALATARPRARLIAVDTRASQVLLAAGHAIKLRRAVPALAEVAQRHQALARELRCNRRVSAAVYVGVYPIPASAAQRPPVAGWPLAAAGEAPIDWALVMRRLPRAHMLDQAIASGRVAPADIDRVAERLAKLYGPLNRPRVSAERVLARIDREQRHNRTELMALAGQLGSGYWPSAEWRARLPILLDRCDHAWCAQRRVVETRADGGEIVEAHGDLRPEHVCLTEPIELIDRLEFDRGLRLLDPWEEIGLLGLLCALAGAAWVGPRLADRIEQAMGRARPPEDLLAFYGAHHALVRARLALSHLREPQTGRARHWQALARRYCGYAEAALGV